jgi:beta-lactamase regulating signal transducer with metallopeptidase domain
MNDLTRLIEPALAEALGWTLLHTLWQGAAIALSLALLLIFSRSRTPHFRYLMSIGAMLSLLLAAVATFVWLYDPAAPVLSTVSEGALALTVITPDAALSTPASNHPTVLPGFFQPYLPLIAGGWLLGVLLLALRLMGEYAYLQHLRHYRCSPAGADWMGRLRELARQTGLTRPVYLKETARIHSPMVSGVLKPVILMPVGMLNGLSTAEVEQILLHELAHIRRYDYLVNIGVAAIETVFFFHPFVWWMGSRIRTEREHACDDLAIEVSGNAATYVTALANAESWRVDGRRLSLAFAGGTVLQRVQRILGQEAGGRLMSGKTAGAILVAGCAGILLAFSTPTQAEQSVPPEPEELEALEMPKAPEATQKAPVKQPALEPQPEPQRNGDTEPDLFIKPKKDTLPPEPEAEELIEREMIEMERALREQERALEAQMIELEKDLQAKLMEQERALNKVEAEQRKVQLELEKSMQELEAQQRELQLQELELEKQELELQRQEEKLETLEEQGQEEAYLQQMRAFQQQEMALEEAKRQLEDQGFALEEQQRQLELQEAELERALESQERALERQMHQMERQRERQVRQLERQHEMLEAEARARKKTMKQRQKQLKQNKAQ